MGMGPWKMGPWKIWNKDWVEYVIGKMENGKRIRNLLCQKTVKVFNMH